MRAGIEPERIDQVLLRHPVVRIGMIRRHRALVAPPQLDALPRHARHGRARARTSNNFFGVEPPDSATWNVPVAAPFTSVDEVVGGRARQRIEIGELLDLHCHQPPVGFST